MNKNRLQFEFYALFMDFVKKHRELFWKQVLKRIRKNNLSDFELRIQEKFPRAWNVLVKNSTKPFSLDVNKICNVAYFQDFGRVVKRTSGISRFVVWGYSVEKERSLYDHYGPFKFIDGKWKISKPYQQFYFPLFRRFNVIMGAVGIKICWVFLPGRYGEIPFKNNHQKVSGPWTKKAQPYIGAYIDKCGDLISFAYGHKNIYAQGSNEVRHATHDQGVLIKVQHEFMFQTIKPVVPLPRWVSDVSSSDFVQLTETEYWCVVLEDGKEKRKLLAEQDYLKAKADGTWIRTLRIVGDPAYDRTNWLKHNGFNPWALDEPFEPGAQMTWEQRFVSMLSKKFMLSTDGNPRGSGEVYCGGTYVNLTYDEWWKFLDRMVRLEEQGQFVIGSDLPKEVFYKDPKNHDVISEDWTLINLDRTKVFNDYFL